ncbi:SDR family oxidoreductase [Streptomyces sp. NPDC050844]|uniref:NAD-dependent epimerase/dehydratase family protein n=1 Tax=Streptomyces sp. NPDC050844 TaxID=3155790 RepID=UPI0033EC34D3
MGDVRDQALVHRLVGESDFVIHAAALADVAACTRSPQTAIDSNITGTQTVLSAAAASDRLQRLVFVSSASVYGNGNPEDWAAPRDEHRDMRELPASIYGRTPPRFAESRPLRPLSVYANTKAFGEVQTKLVLGAVGTSHAIVRYFSVYGEPQVTKPGSDSWVVAWFASRVELGLPLHLHGGGHQVRDLVHVDDFSSAASPSSSPNTAVAPSCWRHRSRLVTRSAGTPPPRTWSASLAGSRRSPWRRASSATRDGSSARRGRCPRGCVRKPEQRTPRRRVGGPGAPCVRLCASASAFGGRRR